MAAVPDHLEIVREWHKLGFASWFWKKDKQKKGIWKRSLRSSRSFLQSEQYKRDLATGLVYMQKQEEI